MNVEDAIQATADAIRQDVEQLGERVDKAVDSGQPLDALLKMIADEERRVMEHYAGRLAQHVVGADRHTRRKVAAAEKFLLRRYRESFYDMRGAVRRAVAVRAASDDLFAAALA